MKCSKITNKSKWVNLISNGSLVINNHLCPIKFKGRVLRVLKPGYDYKMTNIDEVRYEIQDAADNSHTLIIPHWQIKIYKNHGKIKN